MGSNWKKESLTEHYEIRSGLSKPAKDFGSGFPFLTFKNVFYNYFVPSELTELVQSSEKDRLGCSVKRGDVFLTRTSETMNELGMSCVALKDYEHATFNGFCKRLRPKNSSELVPEYVGYYLRSPQFRNEMLAFSTMSTRASLNNEMIGRLEISYPEPSVQKSIAHILKTLDNKIELNRQTNQTLEQMAQALFKSWFVDFDPVFDNMLAKVDFNLDTLLSDFASKLGSDFPDVLLKKAKNRLQALQDRALQQGCDLHALLAGDKNNIHSHFPSEFEFSEQLGWIPKGWESIAVNEMVNTVSDTYPLKTVDKVVFLNTGDILDGKFLHQNYSDTQGLPGQAKKSIKKGDILYSEIRPKNKRFALVNFDGAEHVVSTKLMVLRPNKGFEALFPYFVLTQDKNITILQRAAESRSGTFPQITYTELSMIRVALPEDKKIVELFIETHLKNHFARKDQLDFQNETLTKLRDTLLPKLISGELQIPDVVPA